MIGGESSVVQRIDPTFLLLLRASMKHPVRLAGIRSGDSRTRILALRPKRSRPFCQDGA